MWKFKEENAESDRKLESEAIAKFWPEKIPIILEKIKGSSLNDLPKSKLLCPKLYTVSQLLMCIRMKIKLDKEKALFVFIQNNQLVTGDKQIESLYNEYKDRDGFLYLTYSEHQTLG